MPIDYNKGRPAKGGGESPPPAAPSGPISYTKRPAPSTPAAPSGPISLTKRGQQVSLTKRAGVPSSGPVRINLNWNQQPQNTGKGFLGRLKGAAAGGIDLDLGCLVEMADGAKGVVQALGNSFGSLTQPPYVMLDKDDRSGSATDGENLFISEAHSAEIKRLAVFAFIYQGAPNWSAAGGVVTIYPPFGETVTINLDDTRDGVGMCSICIVHGGADGFVVEREVQYISNHRDLDEMYGWGMTWTRGSK